MLTDGRTMQSNGMPDIFVVGLGIVHVDQLTRETERYMALSNEILYVERGAGVHKFLESKCGKVTDLTRLYVEGGDRLRTYREMAAAVVSAALDRPPVTFALYGHPLIFSYPPFLVREMARYLGLTVKLLPGISAMDCMFADLAIDPSMSGIQIYEATDILIRKRPLQNDVPALIWQIGSLETSLYSEHASGPERFSRFKKHMFQFYPEKHVVYAVSSATHPLLRPQIYEFSIEKIDDYAQLLHAGFTLYVPPTEQRPVQDWKLAEEILDTEHLRRISAGLS